MYCIIALVIDEQCFMLRKVHVYVLFCTVEFVSFQLLLFHIYTWDVNTVSFYNKYETFNGNFIK